MLYAYNICCIYSNAFQNIFTMDKNTMNPNQNAPKGAVWSRSILLAIYATNVNKQMREQMTIVLKREIGDKMGP